MKGEITESISSCINVSLYEFIQNSKRKIYEGTGRNAGLEIMGNLNEIIK